MSNRGKWGRRAFLCAAALCLTICGMLAPQAAEAAGNNAIVSKGLDYDEAYGVFDGYALMRKQLGTTTNDEGYEQPVEQIDVVNAKGEVTFSTVTAGSNQTPYQIMSDEIHGACVEIYDSNNAGVCGVVSAKDGRFLLEPKSCTIEWSSDGSFAVTTESGENGSTFCVYSSPDFALLKTLSYDSASSSYLDLVPLSYDSNEEGLRVTVNAGDPNYQRLYYRCANGKVEEVPADQVETAVFPYVAKDGTPYSYVIDANTGKLSISTPSGTTTYDGPFDQAHSLGSLMSDYYKYCDYILAYEHDQDSSAGSGERIERKANVYRYDGTVVAEFSNVMSVMPVDDGSRFFVTYPEDYDADTGRYYGKFVDAHGTVTGTIPQPERYEESQIVGDYYVGFADDGWQVDVYNSNGQLVDTRTFNGIVNFAYEWDNGFTFEAIESVNGTGVTNRYYYDQHADYLGKNALVILSEKYASLPDGSPLYLGKGVFDESLSLLTTSLKQATLGGYDLAVPRTEHAHVEYPSASHSGAYYAINDSGAYGMVNSSGQVFLPFEYESLADYDKVEPCSLIMVKKDGLWYFLDTSKLVPPVTFSDVDDKTPHADDIRWLAENGISTGWDNGDGTYHFSGMSTVVRQDMAAFLHRLADFAGASLRETVSLKFSDVTDATPHAGDIRWLAATGVSQGWRDEGKETYHFSGMSGVTRQDMAAFLYRLAGSPDYEPTVAEKAKFTDVTDATPHAKEIWWLAKNGVSTGWDDGNGRAHFSGMSTVVRQDMAAFLHRLYEKGLIG